MSTYYFDIRTVTDTVQDFEGKRLPSLSAALEEGRRDALWLAADYLRFPKELPAPEAIMIRDGQGHVLQVIRVKQVVSEVLEACRNTRSSSRRVSGLAIVVAHQEHERFAASAAFRHCGYLVHEASALEDAVETLRRMGSAHPLFRGKRPVIFSALDLAEIPMATLRAARAACPNVWIVLASKAQSRVTFIPRQFTTRQIEDLLLWPPM